MTADTDPHQRVTTLMEHLEQSVAAARQAAAATKQAQRDDWYSRTYPDSPLNAEQRRCVAALGDWMALYNIPRFGKSRADGGFQPCGTGIEVHVKGHVDLATFDFDGLTRLVIAAHRHHCRIEIATTGRHLVLRVHPRQPRAYATHMWEQHPSLGDLEIRAAASDRATGKPSGWVPVLRRVTQSLRDLINASSDPGAEALGAAHEAETLLGRVGQ